jgi:chromosome partitioning protein
VLIKETSIDDIIKPTIIKNLHICPADMNLAGAEVELVPIEKRELVLKSAIEKMEREYEYIFIDCPPSLGLITLNAFAAADSVLVPIQCEYYALEGLGQLVNTIKLVQKGLNKDLEIEGVVLTMYDSRTRLSTQVATEVKKYFDTKVFDTVIPRNIRLGEAPSFGLPITMYDPFSKGARTYKKLAKELLEKYKKK